MYIIYSFQKIDTVIKKKNEATIHPVFLTGGTDSLPAGGAR